MQWKICKKSWTSYIIGFELVQNHPIIEKILAIWSQCVNKRSQDFRYYWDRHFRTEVPPEWQENPIKLLPCRFQHCLGTFNMLTFPGWAEIWLFKHLHRHFFRRLYFRKYISYEAHPFFSKCSKWNVDFRNAVKRV